VIGYEGSPWRAATIPKKPAGNVGAERGLSKEESDAIGLNYDDTIFTEVARWAGETGKTLQLQGRAHTHRGGEIAMTVKTFQVVADRSK
ncbi:MAG: hypothetical protein HY717_13525, partial [Planctomycetes bacterium]|nr:hypothetical protein [Planctomycetota bacterium]